MEITEDTIHKLDAESDKIYKERCCIIETINNDIDNLKESIRLSKIWVNFKYNKCRYTPEVYRMIKKYI
jgi:TATA-box binding protein (TBP) (component of TFIID and TFIIIB)